MTLQLSVNRQKTRSHKVYHNFPFVTLISEKKKSVKGKEEKLFFYIETVNITVNFFASNE